MNTRFTRRVSEVELYKYPMMLSTLLVLATSGKMIIEMTRKMDTCDPQDVAIEAEGTTRMVYAYSNKQPIKNVPTIHTQKGTTPLRLASPGQPTFTPAETDVTHFDIHFSSFTVPFNSPVTGPDTTYYCGVFPMPKFNATRQIIRFEPYIMPKTNLGAVHHLLIYQCTGLNESLTSFRGQCYDPDTPQPLLVCNGGTPIGAWAVGGVGTDYPKNMGFPLVPSATTQYVLMEIHYNNPTEKKIVDQSGMRFYTTGQLRQYNAGIMAFGHTVDGAFQIPAKQQAYTVQAYCPGSCTSQYLPSGGVKFVGGLLHSHLAGRALNLTQIRGGKEIAVILQDKHYDFNFQDTEMLAKEITVLPGDMIHTSCTYNTMDRTTPTPMGLTTHQEMCLAYVIYYPMLVNTTPTCVYANYSNIPGNESLGNMVACFGEPEMDVEIAPYTQLQAPTCARSPPAKKLLTPMLQSISKFNASQYQFTQFLDAAKMYKLHWTLDRQAKLIHMAAELDAPTVGWMGLGISPTGGMVGSDVVMSWVNKNKTSTIPKFSDRFASAHQLPRVDAEQDYYNVVIRT